MSVSLEYSSRREGTAFTGRSQVTFKYTPLGKRSEKQDSKMNYSLFFLRHFIA